MDDKAIQDIKRNFATKFHSQVLKELQPLELHRIKTKSKIKKYIIGYSLISPIIYFIYWLCGLTGGINSNIILGLILPPILGIMIGRSLEKDFKDNIKQKIIPILMLAFENFKWTETAVITNAELENSGIVPYFDEIEVDDNFIGSYKNTPIKISEIKLTYRTSSNNHHSVFKGLVFVLHIPKKFEGQTLIKYKNQINKKLYEEVKLEDPEFVKRFYVDSDNQIEARYLLTPSFMQRFLNIQKTFNAKYINGAFFEQLLILTIPTEKNMFSCGNLEVPITDIKQYSAFLNELITIFELIEELKLYEDIGM